ncbi:hypothetical protein V5799_021690 [Amblyomma americanum]|uniref:ABC transporter domain-containing protein n=1 Tax=Amblyomma americanum TaxID=6943 RepID=A0AAQ4FP93_AMBAM
MVRRLVLLLWKDVYIRRFWRHLPATIAQTVFALLVIYSLNIDISDEAELQAGDAHSSGTKRPVTTTQRPRHPEQPPKHSAHAQRAQPGGFRPTEKPKPKPRRPRVATAMPVMSFPPQHPLESWQSGPGANVERLCFVTATPVLATVAKQAAKILNISEVRVNGVQFDVNVHYRRFLVMPGALNLRTFGETNYLLPIQYAVDTAYLEAIITASWQCCFAQVELQRFPYPSLYPEDFGTTYARVVIRFAIAFWLPFTLFVVQIVDERVSGMRELMRAYGVGDTLYWLSHYLSLLTTVALMGAFSLVVLYGALGDSSGNRFIAATNPALVYLVILCFGSALAVHAMFLSLMFDSTRLAGLLSSVHWFLSLMLPYVFLQNPYGFGYYLTPRLSKLLTSVLPGMFLHWCWMVIERLERFRYGGGLDNFASVELTPDNVTIAQLIIVSTTSSLVIMFFTWYIDNVTTCNGTKVARSYTFLFEGPYWSPPSNKDTPPAAVNIKCKNYEAEPENAVPIVSVNGVSKRYGNYAILNDISLNIFNKQITVLLAPPETGKTTVMKLIAGSLEPDEGFITVGPFDVTENADEARRLISYSPSDTVLFGDLTVEEHLTFFGTAKGIPMPKVRRDVSRIIRDTGLVRYRSWRVDDLTEARQRLLSAAIAVMPYADVQLILLDEPTRNMDPRSRRDLWEVLFKVRRYRGVFLTTSDFAEAEALADRIAVLHRAELLCVGTPEYIKSQFGMGYLLQLQKDPKYKAAAVEALIRKHAPLAEKTEDNATSVVFHLTGSSEALSSLVRDVLMALEKSKTSNGVARIGITVTALEDVLQGISERRSTPAGSREASILELAKAGPVRSAAALSIVAGGNASPGRGQGGGEGALRVLRDRSRDEPNLMSTLNGLIHKRLLDWTRLMALRSTRWLLPTALLLLGGYCESTLLADIPSVRTALVYDVSSVVGESAVGFCGATPRGKLGEFLVHQACPLMEAGSVRLQNIDVTDVKSQLLAVANDDIGDYVFHYQMGVVSEVPEPRFTLWFNGQNPHAAILALNLLHNALLRNLTGDPEAFIRITNTPDNFEGVETVDTLLSFFREFDLSRARRDSAGYVVHAVLVRVLCAVFVPTALCYHAAHFAVPVLDERMSGAKHLQLMTGLLGAVYWLGHLLFDACLGAAHAAAFTLAVTFFRAFLSWPYVFAIYLIFVMYGLLSASLAYVASFWFDNAAKAFYTMATAYIFGGVIGALVATAADLLVFSASPPALQVWIEILMTVPIRWLPTYIVTRGLTKLILLRKESLICEEGGLLLKRYCQDNFLQFMQSLESCCPQHVGPYPMREHGSMEQPLSMGLYSGFFEVSALFLEACICFAAASFLDSTLLQRLWSRSQKSDTTSGYWYPQFESEIDADVRNEAKLVDDICQQRNFGQQALVVRGLSKAYGNVQPRVAVDGVSFAVRRGECFGLVGVLGTGKSSLLGMLGGELFPTSGDAYLRNGLSLTRQYRQWMQGVGYVPYGSGLLEPLTGRETICVFAVLRGIQDVPRTTACLLRLVELDEPDAPVSSYGAGAKTQLSLALALMALPKLYLLDLPELDAPSRAVVRRVLELLRPTSSVVLACEHLHHFEGVCDRIAILVAGRIECIGSVKELREKYCRGITITVYTFPDRKYDLDHQRVIAIDMMDNFPTCELVRCYEGLLEFHIPEPPPGGFCEVFDRLIAMKRRHKFHLFYVSDTTMDQIFASLGRKHAGMQARE